MTNGSIKSRTTALMKFLQRWPAMKWVTIFSMMKIRILMICIRKSLKVIFMIWRTEIIFWIAKRKIINKMRPLTLRKWLRKMFSSGIKIISSFQELLSYNFRTNNLSNNSKNNNISIKIYRKLIKCLLFQILLEIAKARQTYQVVQTCQAHFRRV